MRICGRICGRRFQTSWLTPFILVMFLSTPAFAQDEDTLVEEASDTEATEDTSDATEEQAEISIEASDEDSAPTESSLSNGVGRTPTVSGPSGLFHLISADSTGTGTFGVALFGEFFTGTDVVRAGDDNSRFIGRLSLSYTPLEFLEVFATLSGQGNANSHADPVLIQSLGDFSLGAKGFHTLDNGLSLGGALALSVFNAENSVGLDFSATSVDIRALLGYSLHQQQNIPLDLHFNLGFYVDNSPELFATDSGGLLELQRVERFAHGVSDYNLFEIGLGVEVPVNYVTPFLEWNMGIPVGSDDLNDCDTALIACPHDVGFASFPNVLTLGVKAMPFRQLALNLGVDFGLSGDEATGLPATPPYNVIFGLSYILDPSATGGEPELVYVETPAAPEPTGWVLGEVVDGDSSEPIAGALISYPNSEFTPQSTDPETGRFRSYEFPTGSQVAIEISHPDFEMRSFDRTIGEGQDGIRIRLQPGNLGSLAGVVTNAGGTPLPATIYIRGDAELQIEVDPLTGEFSQRVEMGSYVVTVVADGHVSDRRSLDVSGQVDHSASLDELPDDQAAVLRGDRIDLSGENIRFEDNEDELDEPSSELLDQVAVLLAEYPEISLQVAAHTDDRGDMALTESQANAVVEYLIELGVDPNRLDAMGMGNESPIVPNISNRNRRRNRRVELLFQ